MTDTTARPVSIVTGAFGFSGKYIARRLLDHGHRVRTLTNSAKAAQGPLEVAPLRFDSPSDLERSMRGASVLYNTYWIRFARGTVNHQTAVENSKVLIQAAERAGVRRIVHVSITNPALDSRLPYFRGKAEVEQLIRSSSLSYAILRPAVLFGDEDILFNNIAWFLRRFPVFAVPGEGDYGIQPIFAGDLAELAVECGAMNGNMVLDAVGPEAYPYVELARLIRRTIGSRSRIVHVPPSWLRLAAGVLGKVVDDVVLTKDEISGLMQNLLVSSQPPTARTSFRAWLEERNESVGVRYASELKRHYER